MNILKLGTIEEEEAACRAAWAAMPGAKYGAHIHHEDLAERLYEPIENRINYILSHKPGNEKALRLRLMRPLTAEQWKAYVEAIAEAERAFKEAIAATWKADEEAIAPAWQAYKEALDKAHQVVCTTPGCPYKNGSIFEDPA